MQRCLLAHPGTVTGEVPRLGLQPATAHKPVGTVCFGWAGRDGRLETESRHFTGDRAGVREQAALHALAGLMARA